MTRAVARAATTGDADLIAPVAPVRSSGPGRRLSDVGEVIEVVLMRRTSLGLSLPSSIDFGVSVSTALPSSSCRSSFPSPLWASTSASSFFAGSGSEIASALALVAAASSSRRSRVSSASFVNRSCSSRSSFPFRSFSSFAFSCANHKTFLSLHLLGL